ncbi:hypothetical protein HK101_000411 [Irineochytrium annulatum]|nr:hypothetical protein HK101_000411 [Irineochytrium annulatum]
MFHVAAQALPRKAHQGETIEERSSEWLPPLQRHCNPKTNVVECITLRVRILTGDSEMDYNAKFPPGKLLAGTVCECVAERQGLSKDTRRMFALWIVGRDLGGLQYAHFPQAVDPAHLINRHWFIYRREASVTKETEDAHLELPVINLLYGEVQAMQTRTMLNILKAKRNVLMGRYPCSIDDAVLLAALQIQISLGSWDPFRRPPGYIRQFLENVLPLRMIDMKSPTAWEEMISQEHMRLKGAATTSARVAYLNLVRTWRCYGCSFFPVCHEAPPAGFFEFRIQKWIAGIGPYGLVVFEKHEKANLMHNLAARFAHLYRKSNITGKNLGQDTSTLAKFISSNPPSGKPSLRSTESCKLLGISENHLGSSSTVLDPVEQLEPALATVVTSPADDAEIPEELDPNTATISLPRQVPPSRASKAPTQAELFNEPDDDACVIAPVPTIECMDTSDTPLLIEEKAPEEPPRKLEKRQSDIPIMAGELPLKVQSSGRDVDAVSISPSLPLPPPLSRTPSNAQEVIAEALEEALAASVIPPRTPVGGRREVRAISSLQRRPSSNSFVGNRPMEPERLGPKNLLFLDAEEAVSRKTAFIVPPLEYPEKPKSVDLKVDSPSTSTPPRFVETLPPLAREESRVSVPWGGQSLNYDSRASVPLGGQSYKKMPSPMLSVDSTTSFEARVSTARPAPRTPPQVPQVRVMSAGNIPLPERPPAYPPPPLPSTRPIEEFSVEEEMQTIRIPSAVEGPAEPGDSNSDLLMALTSELNRLNDMLDSKP